jgi:hypothetical protein
MVGGALVVLWLLVVVVDPPCDVVVLVFWGVLLEEQANMAAGTVNATSVNMVRRERAMGRILSTRGKGWRRTRVPGPS